MSVYLGIDFSGNARQWRPHVSRPNVWIARIEDKLLRSIVPVQSLPGGETPFDRLTSLLATIDYTTAGIDAPFSVPHAYVPHGGHAALLAAVACLPHDGRPFPTGKSLLQLLAPDLGPNGAQILRATELRCRAAVNVRSTLWCGPRGGAAFTAACLCLLHRLGRPVWPWSNAKQGLLVEAFPAAQLHTWNLPCQGYNGDSPTAVQVRERIVAGLSGSLVISSEWRHVLADSADAVDAVVSALAAKAVAEGNLYVLPPETAETEGWIAIHR